MKARMVKIGPLADVAAWRRARGRSRRFNGSPQALQVRQAMELPPLKAHRRVKGSVWGVTMVKNEADIILPVVEHLFAQGIDGLLVADNLSTDDTPARLQSLARSLPLYLAHDREEGMFQAEKMTLLSHWARRAGADWIVPFDADELWFAPGATLVDYLRACDADVVTAAMHNLFPAAGVGFRHGSWSLEVAPCIWQKVAFRTHRHAIISNGNHSVFRPGAGRTTDGLRIAHIPWRSYEQFRRKGRQGAEALARTGLDPRAGYHWRHLGSLEDDGLRDTWERILRGETVKEIGWSPSGEMKPVDPFAWPTWDPEGLLGSG